MLLYLHTLRRYYNYVMYGISRRLIQARLATNHGLCYALVFRSTCMQFCLDFRHNNYYSKAHVSECYENLKYSPLTSSVSVFTMILWLTQSTLLGQVTAENMAQQV